MQPGGSRRSRRWVQGGEGLLCRASPPLNPPFPFPVPALSPHHGLAVRDRSGYRFDELLEVDDGRKGPPCCYPNGAQDRQNQTEATAKEGSRGGGWCKGDDVRGEGANGGTRGGREEGAVRCGGGMHVRTRSLSTTAQLMSWPLLSCCYETRASPPLPLSVPEKRVFSWRRFLTTTVAVSPFDHSPAERVSYTKIVALSLSAPPFWPDGAGR